MFLVSKSQPYGFQCEKTNKKHYLPCLFFSKHFFFLVEQTFFFCLTKKKKKDLLVLVGITFFRVWFFKPLQTVPPQNSGHHLITLWLLLRKFFGAQLYLSVVISVFKAHHLGACELFVCTISQEPLYEIFSYLVVASSEVSWDAHTGNTPLGFDHGLKLPKCASLW